MMMAVMMMLVVMVVLAVMVVLVVMIMVVVVLVVMIVVMVVIVVMVMLVVVIMVMVVVVLMIMMVFFRNDQHIILSCCRQTDIFGDFLFAVNRDQHMGTVDSAGFSILAGNSDARDAQTVYLFDKRFRVGQF